MSLLVINIALVVSCYSHGTCLCSRVRVVSLSLDMRHFEFQFENLGIVVMKVGYDDDTTQACPTEMIQTELRYMPKTHPIVCSRRSFSKNTRSIPPKIESVSYLENTLFTPAFG